MIENITLKNGKKAFFASDIHLGLHPYAKSAEREKVFVRWLTEIQPQAQVLFLLGDVFDFWYEYKKVVPRGFTRFLGKLSEICDSGVEVHFFTGNHDVWVFDYLPKEIGVKVHRTTECFQMNGKVFVIGHGDGLSHDDLGYKILKRIFTSSTLQFLFSRLHPNLALWFGHTWSKHSRLSKGVSEAFLGEEKEHQILFARHYLKDKHSDYFVFGHRHIAMDFELTSKSHLINLGEWISAKTYAIFDGSEMKLCKYESV
jgi:UDP-2,3-diacylglucosamine hydrolase